ncbi:hypothetical protein Patl1_25984 [Pistacia atlantica]|uniref:Uncharacterized protein n=1 Tax=Pistacia atlantica TaxID=434234 RepID=A0ACC1B2K7_9ROSI|nr:hypothetical protein Patl1_25984 [Pistacia atlantica]
MPFSSSFISFLFLSNSTGPNPTPSLSPSNSFGAYCPDPPLIRILHSYSSMYSAIHSLPLDGTVGGHADFQSPLDGTNLPGDACLVLTTDPKPRLRWTAELHERFVDAVTQLGGPDSS